ncbi:MAG TPA: hypothetical protein VGL55_06640 [Steroidobacteraceae bacterium]
MLIPLVAVTLGLGCAILSVIGNHRRRLSELEFRHRERMAAIEKGLELPPEPPQAGGIDHPPERKTPSAGSRFLLRGLVWMGIGFALVVPGNRFDHDFWSFGWIAVAVGGAYLIYYMLEGRHLGSPRAPGSPGGPDQPRDGNRP